MIRAFVLMDENDPVQEDIALNGGLGDDLIQYSINSPVSIDGGSGFDKVVAIGTEADDSFVITEDGIMGCGLNIQLSNV